MSNSIDVLAKDMKFIEKLEQTQSEDEVLALFKENGVELSQDELKAFVSESQKEELDEDSLDDVAGGILSYRVGLTVARWLIRKCSTGGGGGHSFGSGSGGGFR
jgi:predicted ribosomally synthesized peptide with nif11-like leader